MSKAWLEANKRRRAAKQEQGPKPQASSVALVRQVIEAEVVEGEIIEEGDEDAPKLVVLTDPTPSDVARRPKKPQSALRRFGRFAARQATQADEDRLYGTERLEVGVHRATERLVDKALDGIEKVPDMMPTLRDRGAAYRGRKMGRSKTK